MTERLTGIEERLRVLDSDPNGVLNLEEEQWLATRVRELEAERTDCCMLLNVAGPLRHRIQIALNERAEALVRVRELEDGLRPFAAMYQEDNDVKRISDSCHITWHYDMYGTQPLKAADLRRAAALIQRPT